MGGDTLAEFRRGSGAPITLDALDQAYLSAHEQPFYFTQTCGGEVVDVFHPLDEPRDVVATKKMFVNQLSHRANTVSDEEHTEHEFDNHGKRATLYQYARGDGDDTRHVHKSFDAVRAYAPPASMRQTGDVWNSWRARTADQQTTSIRQGVAHRIERRSTLDFPPNAAEFRGHVGRKRTEGVELNDVEDEEHERRGNSFWLRARAHSTTEHRGVQQRKRVAPLPTQAASGQAMIAHLNKRHELEFVHDDAPHVLESDNLPGPGTLEDTLEEVLADDASVESTVQLHLLLLHDGDATRAQIERLLAADAATSVDARTRMLRVLAEVGGAAEQAVLRRAASDVELDSIARGRALMAMRSLMRPDDATLTLLRTLMRKTSAEREAQPSAMMHDTADARLRKQATLMFGVLAENVNASDTTLAHNMRRELLERWMFAGDDDERHLLAAALDNAYLHGTESEDIVRDRLALGLELREKYEQAVRASRKRHTVINTRAGVRLRAAIPPPRESDDTSFCDAATNRKLRVEWRDASDAACEPCDPAIGGERCLQCQQVTVTTAEQCEQPRCADLDDCGARATDTLVNADGVECGQDGVDNVGAPCVPQTCMACTDCRDPDGRPCGALCMSSEGKACPEPPSWFEEQFTMFFGANLCAGVERFKRCEAVAGKRYNDLRPLQPDEAWSKRIGGQPITGKLEVIMDGDTTDNARLPPCAEGADPWARGAKCKREDIIDWKIFSGAWAGLEAYEKGQQYDYNPNSARLEIAAAYLQVKSAIHQFWLEMAEDREAAADSVCDAPIEFSLYYSFAGKTYYHETTKDVVKDMSGKSTCFLAEQTCEPSKPPERAWHTSTKDIYTRYLPNLLSNFDLGGIPLKLELLVKSQARVHHAVVYQYNEFEGGLLLSGYVEPQADAQVTMTASIAWAAKWGNTDEAAQAQEMRNLIRVGIKAHIEVFAVEFPAVGAVNFETGKPCANVVLNNRALGGRVDVILEVAGVNVLQFLGGLFGVKQTLYEWKGIQFEIPFVEGKCCKLCPGSCQDQTLEANGLNGDHSRCDFTRGECVCTPGWDGEECMIPCPESCDVDVGVLCDSAQPFTVGNGRYAPRDRCKCQAGSWGYDCSLACPGGRKNPCSGHTDTKMTWMGEQFTTCNSDGTCDCWAHPPQGPFFGKRCDITCGDPDLVAPLDDPDFTRCGRLGETRAECKFDAALGAAECKCARSYYGPKCDQICPLTDDDRQAPCSLRGDCEEIDGRAVCLCDLGFYGEVCEFIAFEGSGVALAFVDSERDDDVAAGGAEFPLTPVQLRAAAGQGFTVTGWFQAHELPASARGASLLRWRWGDVRLGKDGHVELCDDSSCLQSSGTVALGTDESAWYWFAASVQNSALGTGSRRVWLMRAADAQVGAPAEDQQGHTAVGTDVVTVGAKPFVGLIDHVHIIHRVATEADLTDYRVGTVAHSTPGILFQALCDEGRADHVYAEMPFVPGDKHRSVGWARSFAPLQWATLNSVIAPPLKLYDPNLPALRAYGLVFEGKRINRGYVSFRALSPDSDRKRAVACRLSAYLVDPQEDLETFDSFGSPLSDADLRAADKRERFALFEDRMVSGSELSAMIDPIELPRAVLQRLRSGQVELEWKVLPNQPECNRADRPLIIENSFVTLHVEQVDGMVQTLGLDTGYMSVQPKSAVSGSWSFEAWVYLETVRTRSAADSAIAMLYPRGQLVDLSATPASWALFLLGDTNRGAEVRYSGATARVNGYELHQRRADWMHVALVMRHSGSQCTPELFVDGVSTGVARAASCGNGAIPNWGASSHELRVGSKFEGRFNDVLFWTRVIDPAATMHMQKDFAASSLAFGFAFDDRQEMSTQGDNALQLRDDSGNNQPVSLVKGVIRGHIYGAFHRWKNCPGIDEVLAPERVCGNTLIQERGVCLIEDEENEGIIEMTYKCKCNEGFAGKACQKQCPGAVKVGAKTALCSGHGKCLTIDAEDDVMCECDEGYTGTGCELTCPGWDASNPPGQKECNGKGECQLNAARTEAICKCFAASNSYGLACEYEQNALPIRGCDECSGANEVCRDGICDCEHPYYRIGENCQLAQHASKTVVLEIVAIIVAIAMIFV